MKKAEAFPLLQIKDLSIGFAQGGEIMPAVNNLNLEIGRGEIVALVGESGSGKSVTALSILQLLALGPAVHTSGAILFSEQGEAPVNLLQHNAIQQIRGNRIGMIFQEPMSALNPVMTCGKQVQEVLRQHKPLTSTEAKAATIQWFEKVKIPDPQNAYHKYPHQMSGGQKQRVMIAMAMCCSPALLLCDEPTTALDVTVQQHILELIKELQAETDMGVLFITHDLGVVARIADRAAIIYRGNLLETGTTQQIFTTPGHAYTKALIACRPAAQPKGARLPVVSDFMEPANATPGSKAVPEHARKEEVLVRVKNLIVSFPVKRNIWGAAIKTFNAVDDVSFDIYRGETLGLVGESGCGKTTLGRSLLRLAAPTSGSIFISNKEITALDNRSTQKFRKDVQLVFQDPFAALNPRLTIGDALDEPLALQPSYANGKGRREKVAQLLQLVQLPAAAAHRYPHQFSGGQRQRIVIARALATDPLFLVCDESVSALDVSVQAQVLNLLNDLKKELVLTLLFISHDLNVVRHMSDRLMVMQRGKIVESGSSADVFLHPKHDYTKELLAAIPAV